MNIFSWPFEIGSIYVDYYSGFLSSSVKWWTDNAKSITEIGAAIAVFVGGFSAYLRFFYGQTLFYRVDPDIETKLIKDGDKRFLKIKVKAKNIGTVSYHFSQLSLPPSSAPTLSNSRFYQKVLKHLSTWLSAPLRWWSGYRRWARCEKTPFMNESWLLILRGHRPPTSSYAADLTWDDPLAPWGVLQLFPSQEWIRAGETIFDEYLVELPADDTVAVRVEARLIGKARLLRPCGDEWHAYSVLTLNTDQ